MTSALSPTFSPARTGAPSAAVWTGRVLSALVVLVLLADAAVSLFAPEKLAEPMAATGFSAALAPQLATLMLVCAALYAIPRTSVLGAILTTGFLGGAICAHFRIGEMGSGSQIVCLLIGVAAWLGLYLRMPALRALLPLGQG
ncbi:DoxX family protein [Xenophilus aerolatus]|nr:DoxX family protein [Xenophilus aerolatus]